MRGAILTVNPRAVIVDLTHGIPPGRIQAGAFALAAAYRSFPRHTIHVAVVDPGVGGSRLPLLVQTSHYWFIGPDNGVLSWALLDEEILSVRSIDNPTFMHHPVSRTFHGRDIFGPAAAHLSLGKPPASLGRKLDTWSRLKWPTPLCETNRALGEIIYTDRFGNLITNIPESSVRHLDPATLRVQTTKRRRTLPIVDSYTSVPDGKPMALIGSSQFLELAVNGGSAATLLGLGPGHPVEVHRKQQR